MQQLRSRYKKQPLQFCLFKSNRSVAPYVCFVCRQRGSRYSPLKKPGWCQRAANKHGQTLTLSRTKRFVDLRLKSEALERLVTIWTSAVVAGSLLAFAFPPAVAQREPRVAGQTGRARLRGSLCFHPCTLPAGEKLHSAHKLLPAWRPHVRGSASVQQVLVPRYWKSLYQRITGGPPWSSLCPNCSTWDGWSCRAAKMKSAKRAIVCASLYPAKLLMLVLLLENISNGRAVVIQNAEQVVWKLTFDFCRWRGNSHLKNTL